VNGADRTEAVRAEAASGMRYVRVRRGRFFVPVRIVPPRPARPFERGTLFKRAVASSRVPTRVWFNASRTRTPDLRGPRSGARPIRDHGQQEQCTEQGPDRESSDKRPSRSQGDHHSDHRDNGHDRRRAQAPPPAATIMVHPEVACLVEMAPIEHQTPGSRQRCRPRTTPALSRTPSPKEAAPRPLKLARRRNADPAPASMAFDLIHGRASTG
jgi:hypothetical protein